MNAAYLAGISAFFAGLTAIFAKQGSEGAPASVAVFFRTIVIVLFMGAFTYTKKIWVAPQLLPGKTLLWLVLSGLTTSLSWFFYFRALQVGSVALVASIDKLSLVVALVLAGVFLRESIGGSQWIGAGLMVAGAVLIARP